MHTTARMQVRIFCHQSFSRTYGVFAQPFPLSFFDRNDRCYNRVVKPQAVKCISGEPLSSSFHRADVLSPQHLVRIYSQLSKSRLTALVVLTAMSGVALSPLPASVPILLSTALGTALCSASANSLNQLQEVPFDAQMTRTRMRPLVRRAISPLHAVAFASTTGIAGVAILWTSVNPITALLGVGNIALYAGLYTWLKRRSIVNTWVGAVVGAIPPLMGWTACGGSLSWFADSVTMLSLPTFTSPITTAAISVPSAIAVLALFLFSWQFPHFNPLSHIGRGSYAQAGFKMLSSISPRRNALVALRHALLLIPTCSILVPISGLTTWSFALTALVPNVICVRAAWKFWRMGGEKEARTVFQHSVWYLPVILGLMMLHKQGIEWQEWAKVKELLGQ
jgi:protoheme IX farnesyltransferase